MSDVINIFPHKVEKMISQAFSNVPHDSDLLKRYKEAYLDEITEVASERTVKLNGYGLTEDLRATIEAEFNKALSEYQVFLGKKIVRLQMEVCKLRRDMEEKSTRTK